MSAHGTMLATPSCEPDSHVFDLWAQVYDSQPNPLLALEEREAMSLLPSMEGCDVLDVGCGTGRWLSKLEGIGCASLAGTDCSPSMLEAARAKVGSLVELRESECTDLPWGRSSKTLILASFLLSYVDDVEMFARECARVIRPGGWLLISDMHPVTARERNWTRSFSLDETKVQIRAKTWPLDEILSCFRRHGFEIETLIEPPFDQQERLFFESAGKVADFESLAKVPAIYIAKFRKRARKRDTTAVDSACRFELSGCRVASGPARWIEGAIEIEGKYVGSLRPFAKREVPAIDLSGYAVLPGLINAHDHLDFGLFPNLGRIVQEPSYINSAEWAFEIHKTKAADIERYQSVPKANRAWWGALRNLLCGVTTVCHHNPIQPEFHSSDFPVHVVSELRWSHSLGFDKELIQKFNEAPSDLPFVLHAAEGVDQDSFDEILMLDEMGLLDRRTVLVHGLALTAETASLINRRGVALIACPTSNVFLFGRTLHRDLLLSIERLALGSDSCLTAAGDLLDEVRYLRSSVDLDSETIYKMVTSNAAKMLGLKNGEGSIAESGTADLIAVRGDYETPGDALTRLTFDKMELVVLSGEVLLASPTLYEKLPEQLRSNMQLLDVGGHLRWVRAPISSLICEAEGILGEGNLRLSGRQVRYAGAV